MRVLVGPVDPKYIAYVRQMSPRRGDEIFGYSGDMLSYGEIMAHLPDGWQPDVLLHLSLEYNAVPEGIEEANCLTAGIVGDWNLGAQAYHRIGGAFDALFADKTGCERLRVAGFSQVFDLPLFPADPQLRWNQPQPERDLDIVMIGSLNFGIQRDRERWAARVARLSAKYRVCITGGVFGDDYARLMNRAKIVFNRSIRGEINMRVYEAAECGALVFYERENAEIRALFTDREHCVLYGEDDLQDLLDTYLSPLNSEERQRIAEAGRKRVQTETRAHRLAQILELLDGQRENLRARAERSLRGLSPAERQFRYACQWMRMPEKRLLVPAECALQAAACEAGESAELRNAQACLWGEQAAVETRAEARLRALDQALSSARRALELSPGYSVARFNLAQLLLEKGEVEAAQAELIEADRQLVFACLPAEALRGPYLARSFALFTTELEAVWAAHPPETAAWAQAMRDLLLWRIAEQLCDLAFARQDTTAAREYAEKAVLLRPRIGTTRHRLARALAALGRREEARAEMWQAYRDAPLNPDLWTELATLLLESGHHDRCRTFLEEIESILNGCPPFAGWRSSLETFRAACRGASADESASSSLRLLALPDWNHPPQWRALLRGYIQTFRPRDAVTLILPVDERRMESLVTDLERFLIGTLRTTFEAIPDITLLAQSAETPSADLLASADILVLLGNQAAEQAAVRAGLQALPLSYLSSLAFARHAA